MLGKSLALLVGAVALIRSANPAPKPERFSVVTYNVAGLPDGAVTPHPSSNMPLIGRLLGKYDLVLVQEDFVYPDALRKELDLPYQSPAFVRGKRLDFGDGLSQFSRFPFAPLEREPWRECHGVVGSYFDCLTPKGFTFTRQTLADHAELDVYNVHLDAGWDPADASARQAQIEQLIAAIAKRSSGRAVLLAGDTNIPRYQRALLKRLVGPTGLIDACAALHCGDPGRIDRVFYRSSDSFRLTPKATELGVGGGSQRLNR